MLDSSQSEDPVEIQTPHHITWWDRICMVLIGLINNIFFLIVGSSAQRIVEHYKATGMLGMVNWSCTVCGLFAGSLNAWLSSRSVSYDLRFSITAACKLIGLLGAALAPEFWIACISIVFVGFACNFGESVALGYLAYIHKQPLVKCWGIGTGMAGVCGAGFSALCVFLDFNYTYSFYALLPLVAIYLLCYFCVLREKKGHAGLETGTLDTVNMLNENENNERVRIFSCAFLKKIWYYIITVDIVYFAGYVIAGAFMDCAQEKRHDGSSKKSYMFPLLALVQHVGVVLFCLSATLVEFKLLWALVVFQIVNFFVWMSQAMLHWMETWDQFILIFIVGSVAGLNYVSTYNMILNDPRLTYKEKEIGTNVTAFTVTVAVLLAAGFTVLSENTYLRPFVPE